MPKPHRRISDEDLLQDLRRIATKIGKAPNIRDVLVHGRYNVGLYTKRFKGIRKARKKIGFKKGKFKRARVKITNEMLLEDLKRLVIKLGRSPSRSDVDKYGILSSSVYVKRFRGLNKAKEKVGLEVSKRSAISDKKLLDFLRDLAYSLERTPNSGDIRRERKYSVTTFVKHFGSLNKAQKRAGLKETTRKKKYSEEELLNELRRLAAVNGSTPTLDVIKRNGKYSIRAYDRYFGNLRNAQRKAGLEEISGNGKRADKKELLNFLKDIAETLGRTPKAEDIRKQGKYSVTTYMKHFGSLRNAQKMLGLMPTLPGNRKENKK